MPVHDEIGKRMKHNYEEISKTRLTRRIPVAIRLDGKSFHSFCRNFQKPFDEILIKSMQETTQYLCKNIQGCVFGYCQSDEITLILTDYTKLTSEAYFDYEVQKICSITASMCTLAFNRYFAQFYDLWTPEELELDKFKKLCEIYENALNKGAMFDSRCFNIPKEEVCNLIYWRQLDATRNSIQMVGQTYFSHKELHGLSCKQIQEKLFSEKGINWNDFPVYQKRGTAVYKDPDKGWIIDKNMPILKKISDIDFTYYVNKWI